MAKRYGRPSLHYRMSTTTPASNGDAVALSALHASGSEAAPTAQRC